MAVRWGEAERYRGQSFRGPPGEAGVTADRLPVTAASQPCVPPPSRYVLGGRHQWPSGLLPSLTFQLPSVAFQLPSLTVLLPFVAAQLLLIHHRHSTASDFLSHWSAHALSRHNTRRHCRGRGR